MSGSIVQPTPPVSVVLPAHNAAIFIADAVSSALRQTLPPTEVIVVDDGSTDTTMKVLEHFGGEICVIHQENQGVAAARNAGIAAARGSLIAFLDADDVWLPNKLKRQAARFAADPALGLVHCAIREVDQTLTPISERTSGLEGRVADLMLVGQDSRLHASGSTMMVSRAALDAIGNFDELLPPAEDWDLTYRIARCFPVGFVREPLVLYRHHPANAHWDIPRMERGMFLAYEKAFAASDPQTHVLKSRAYADLHLTLAGSYWRDGDLCAFARHSWAALRGRPAHFAYFAALPVRRARRRFARTKAGSGQVP